jgi:hypothetical protein
MIEQTILPNTANLAKEKGYDEHICRCGGYPDCICDDLLPTQSLLQKWLREIHGIHVNPVPYHETADHSNEITGYYCGDIETPDSILADMGDNFGSYEEALEFGLKKGLQYLK